MPATCLPGQLMLTHLLRNEIPRIRCSGHCHPLAQSHHLRFSHASLSLDEFTSHIGGLQPHPGYLHEIRPSIQNRRQSHMSRKVAVHFDRAVQPYQAPAAIKDRSSRITRRKRTSADYYCRIVAKIAEPHPYTRTAARVGTTGVAN